MRSWHKGAFLLILLLCCLAGAVCLSLFTGSSSLSLGELYHALQAGDKTDTTHRIFLYVRRGFLRPFGGVFGIDGVGGSTLGGFCGGSCHQSVHLRFGGKNRGIPYHFGIGWRGCQQYIIRRY